MRALYEALSVTALSQIHPRDTKKNGPKLRHAVPVQAWTSHEGSGICGSQISRQSAHEGGKVLSPTQRPPLTLILLTWRIW